MSCLWSKAEYLVMKLLGTGSWGLARKQRKRWEKVLALHVANLDLISETPYCSQSTAWRDP